MSSRSICLHPSSYLLSENFLLKGLVTAAQTACWSVGNCEVLKSECCMFGTSQLMPSLLTVN